MSYATVQGDTEPSMQLTCYVNGSPENLTGSTDLRLRRIKPDGTVDELTLTAISLALGTLKRVWGATDNDIPGRYLGQVVVTRASGGEQTFPNLREFFSWDVVERIGFVEFD